MAISVITSSTGTGTTGNLVINVPSGIQNGDLLVAWLTARAATVPPTIALLSGWTSVISDQTSQRRHHRLAYKVASGESGSWTWTITGSPTISVGGIIVLRGQAASPIDASAITIHDAGESTAVAPSVTTGQNGCMLLIGYTAGFSSGSNITFATPASPSGITEQFDVGGQLGCALDYLWRPEAGVTGDISTTISVLCGWSAMQVSVKAAAVEGGVGLTAASGLADASSSSIPAALSLPGAGGLATAAWNNYSTAMSLAAAGGLTPATVSLLGGSMPLAAAGALEPSPGGSGYGTEAPLISQTALDLDSGRDLGVAAWLAAAAILGVTGESVIGNDLGVSAAAAMAAGPQAAKAMTLSLAAGAGLDPGGQALLEELLAATAGGQVGPDNQATMNAALSLLQVGGLASRGEIWQPEPVRLKELLVRAASPSLVPALLTRRLSVQPETGRIEVTGDG